MAEAGEQLAALREKDGLNPNERRAEAFGSLVAYLLTVLETLM